MRATAQEPPPITLTPDMFPPLKGSTPVAIGGAGRPVSQLSFAATARKGHEITEAAAAAAAHRAAQEKVEKEREERAIASHYELRYGRHRGDAPLEEEYTAAEGPVVSRGGGYNSSLYGDEEEEKEQEDQEEEEEEDDDYV